MEGATLSSFVAKWRVLRSSSEYLRSTSYHSSFRYEATTKSLWGPPRNESVTQVVTALHLILCVYATAPNEFTVLWIWKNDFQLNNCYTHWFQCASFIFSCKVSKAGISSYVANAGATQLWKCNIWTSCFYCWHDSCLPSVVYGVKVGERGASWPGGRFPLFLLKIQFKS